jgi:hypothetical protein
VKEMHKLIGGAKGWQENYPGVSIAFVLLYEGQEGLPSGKAWDVEGTFAAIKSGKDVTPFVNKLKEEKGTLRAVSGLTR